MECRILIRRIFGCTWSAATPGAAFLLTFVLTHATVTHAQQFQMVHLFTYSTGITPAANLTPNPQGGFYGSTLWGGKTGSGVIFQMTQEGSHWNVTPIYEFQGRPDGEGPGNVAIGPDGALYGATTQGGDTSTCYGFGCGTIFRLTRTCNGGTCQWKKTILYEFQGGNDGAVPGGVYFGPDGSLYGTTPEGGGPGCGGYGCGTLYRLSQVNGEWVETVIHRFGVERGDTLGPEWELTIDSGGNVYGTGGGGLYGWGSIFEFMPSESGWIERILYNFQRGADGEGPIGGVILDGTGNLYGTTFLGGPGQGGTVFKLTPANGQWSMSIIHSFTWTYGQSGPEASLIMDAAGNIYGTTYQDGRYGWGTVFKLAPRANGWTYTDFHDFSGGLDGGQPESQLTLDAQGNVFGTTPSGGNPGCWENSCGVIFKVVQ